MTTAIMIPSPLRQFTRGLHRVDTAATTTGDALDDLATQFPSLRTHLYLDGGLRQFINVFVNSDNMRDLNGVATPISSRDTLFIIPSIAGG